MRRPHSATRWVAFDDTCTHEECSLAEGELDGAVIVCPCHGSEFDVRTGDVLTPAGARAAPDLRGPRGRRRAARSGSRRRRVAEEAAHAREDHVTAEPVARAVTVAGPVARRASSLDDVDLTDLDVWEERVPYDWLALLRRDAPLFWQPEVDGRGFWAFTRYDDVVAGLEGLGDVLVASSAGRRSQDLTPEELEARKSMLDTDPPPHTRMRALVNKGFTPRVVNTYEERIRGLAQGILAAAFEQDEFDWVESVAAEIPMWVFSEIMGLPVEDRKLIIELGDKLLGNTDPEVVGEENVVERGASDPKLRMLPFSSPFSLDLIEYGRALGEKRRHEPRDDITTRLVEAEIDGSRLTEQEFGVDLHPAHDGRATRRRGTRSASASPTCSPTPTSSRGSSPTRRSRAPRPTSSSAARIRCTTSAAPRRGTSCSTGGGSGRGDKVTIWYAGANYDEEKFADPYRLDVGRTPNRHLTFGLGGPHFCLGAHLAKLEVKVWLEEMIPYLARHRARRASRCGYARTSSTASSACPCG